MHNTQKLFTKDNLWSNKYTPAEVSRSLPKSFLWGGAVASNQADGGYNLGGRGLSNADIIPQGENRLGVLEGKNVSFCERSNEVFPSRYGIDFYNQYPSDISLINELGLNAFKLSASWSRVYPTGEEEQPNGEGIMFYHKLIQQLKSANIEPILVLSHYDIPLNLVKKYGGWANRKLIEFFIRYARTMSNEFSNEVKYWIPLHEIDILLRYPYLVAGICKNEDDSDQAWSQKKVEATHHMLLAQALAEAEIHKVNPQAIVGCMIGQTISYPATCNPLDVLQAQYDNEVCSTFLDPLIRGHYPSSTLAEFKKLELSLPIEDTDMHVFEENPAQFLMFPYYNSLVSSSNNNIDNKYLEDGIDPVGLRIILRELYRRYEIPLIIGEFAMGEEEQLESGRIHDSKRIGFLKSHIKSMKESIYADGVDLRGCILWEVMDTISVSKGTMSRRYGLIYVDKNDDGTGSLKRIPKDSYYWLQEELKRK